ncbi:MAG: hypothetical protein KKH72_12030, partial [Alphaproteobacteria bacterium]|nr:hypothetical protein [Alphaproteobacteria bacterium]
VVSRDALARRGLTEELKPLLARLEQARIAVFDTFVATPFGIDMPTIADYQRVLDGVGEGLSYGAFHFAMPDHDIEGFATDSATRIADYRVFASGFGRRMMDERGIEMVGVRQLTRA